MQVQLYSRADGLYKEEVEEGEETEGQQDESDGCEPVVGVSIGCCLSELSGRYSHKY